MLQAMHQAELSVWLCTASTQPITHGVRLPTPARGASTACRQERKTLPVCCADACTEGTHRIAMLIHHHALRLSDDACEGCNQVRHRA